MCFSLLWRRASYQGILAGMVTGTLLIQLWPWLEKMLPVAPVTIWNGGLIPSFSSACLAIWLVSLLTQGNRNQG